MIKRKFVPLTKFWDHNFSLSKSLVTEVVDPALLYGREVPVGSILYNSSVVVQGFEMGFDGTPPYAGSGGDAAENGLPVSTSQISNSGVCQGECQGMVLIFDKEGMV